MKSRLWHFGIQIGNCKVVISCKYAIIKSWKNVYSSGLNTLNPFTTTPTQQIKLTTNQFHSFAEVKKKIKLVYLTKYVRYHQGHSLMNQIPCVQMAPITWPPVTWQNVRPLMIIGLMIRRLGSFTVHSRWSHPTGNANNNGWSPRASILEHTEESIIRTMFQKNTLN